MSDGPNTNEAQKLVQRFRAKAIAVVMQSLEADGERLHPAEMERIKAVVKDEINAMADGICALLPSLVDETVPMNVLAMEMLAGLTAVVEELKDAVLAKG